MKKTSIYLAGPSKCEKDEGQSWRKKLTNDWGIAEEDYTFFNPLDYFRYSENWHQSDKQVKQYFLSRLKNCDVMLVNLENTESSCGTCQEVQYAVDHEIPVIGFGKQNIYNWLLVDCQCVFDTVEEAMEYIIDYYVN